jgi:hypothetical protein
MRRLLFCPTERFNRCWRTHKASQPKPEEIRLRLKGKRIGARRYQSTLEFWICQLIGSEPTPMEAVIVARRHRPWPPADAGKSLA